MSSQQTPLSELFAVAHNEDGLQRLHINVETISEILSHHDLKTMRLKGDDRYLRGHLRKETDEDDSFAFINETKHYDGNESPIRRYCIMKVLENLFDTVETLWVDDYGGRTSARWETAEIHRDEYISIPKQMYGLMERKNDQSKWVVRYQTWEDGECQITLYTREPQDEVNEVWKAFSDYFIHDGPLMGECFTPTWKYLKHQDKQWEDVVLNEEVREKLNLHVVDFFKNLDKYGEVGLRTSRGVILAGKPGTGKTLTLDIIMNEFNDYTRIYATAETLCGRHHIRDMYNVARKLSPTIVFIEDIDTIGSSDDDESYRTPLLGEILTALNSVESNDGVLTIATTNYPDALDIALRDRPGRFDARIDFPVPDKSGRKAIMERLLIPFKHNLKTTGLDEIISATDGFTGAWLTELIQTAFTFALRKNPSKPLIDKGCMKSSLKIVKESRSRIKGNQKDDSPMY